jgi:hypothetical protein
MADNNEEILLKLKIQTDKANAALKKTDAAIKKTVQSFKKLEKGSIEYQEAQAKLAGLQANYAEQSLKYNKALEAQIGNKNKGLTGVSDATGAATSATLELGRAISDAPYGIRGVANNISQLASQFSFMSNKVDETTGKVVGFNGALKQFGQAIKANAILLLIQAVISAMDYFANKVSDADKALKKLSESTVSETITELTLLKRALEDSSKPLEEKQKLIKGAREEYEDFNDAIKETPDDIAAAITALGLLTQKYKDFARAKALTELVTDSMKDQAKTLASYSGDWTDMFNSFDAFGLTVGTLLSGRGITGISQAMTNELSESSDAIKTFEEMLNQPTKSDPTKTYLELIYGSKGKRKEIKTAKISPFKTKEALDLDVENNLTAIQKLQRQTKLINLKTEEQNYINSVESEEEKLAFKEFYAQERLKIELDYELKAIDAKEAAEKASVRKKATIRIKELEDDLAKYKKNLEDKGIADTAASKESMAKAKKEVDEKIALTKTEAERTVQQITEKYAALFPFWTQMADARRNALGVGSGEEGEEPKEIDKISEFIGNYKTLMSGLTDFIDGEFERELTIEQNRTNVLNKQLNDRLLNERLSADQRKSIQNEIAQNDENLRIKQDAIAKKKFKTAKAFAISMAVADTYLAGVKVLADPSFVGRPFARGIAMAATIASGLASVAAISRQKFQSTSAATPVNVGGGGASGETSERSEPSFNIVGRSNDNLLINAIQAQFGKPLKAYVVSRDVTTQQQLDGMIVGQAGT